MSDDIEEPGIDTAIGVGTLVGIVAGFVIIYTVLRRSNVIQPLY